jgi:hypothetical protein
VRVLTFNTHQPYLHTLSSLLPWTFGVVAPRLPSGRVRDWDVRLRPKPANVRLYPDVDSAGSAGDWDWILVHNVQDLLDVRHLDLPKVFLVHGTLSGRILQDRADMSRERYLSSLGSLLRASRCRLAYISELKRNDWGLPGEVIRSTVDLGSHSGYRGETRAILQVCNNLVARGAMLGWDAHREVCRGLPAVVIGQNTGLEYSRKARDWADLREQYRAHRVYLHTAVFPLEDGYNLAMLEAMATGMPVASLAPPTSPVRDGFNGVMGETAADLRSKVISLLDDPDRARELGAAARRTVEQEFSPERFRSAWADLARRSAGKTDADARA